MSIPTSTLRVEGHLENVSQGIKRALNGVTVALEEIEEYDLCSNELVEAIYNSARDAGMPVDKAQEYATEFVSTTRSMQATLRHVLLNLESAQITDGSAAHIVNAVAHRVPHQRQIGNRVALPLKS